jgi:hypothetical protein
MQQLKDGVEEGPEEAAEQKQMEEAAFDMCVDCHWSEKKVHLFQWTILPVFSQDFMHQKKP